MVMKVIGTVFGLFIGTVQGFACSLAEIPQDELFNRVRLPVAEHFDLEESWVWQPNFGRFAAHFPKGLGADCSGLEYAFFSSSFQVLDTREGYCVHTGNLTIEGYGSEGELTIQKLATECR